MNPHVFQFRFIPVLLITLQAACNPFAIPSMDPVQVQGNFKKVTMPKGGIRGAFYRKDNPHKLFLSQKEKYGPGLMLDLDTGKQEWVDDRDPDPFNVSLQQPGESREAYLDRIKIEPIAPGELFSCATWLSITSANDLSTRTEGYCIQLQGEYTKTYGLATKGDFFPTGLRKTEDELFTGDLVLNVYGKLLVSQHFKHMPTSPLRSRTHGALNVGLVFYADEPPDGSGDLYIFQVPRHVAEPESEPLMPEIQFNPSAP